MDTQRLLLFIALSFVSLLLWDAWQKDYPQNSSLIGTQDPSQAYTPSIQSTTTNNQENISVITQAEENKQSKPTINAMTPNINAPLVSQFKSADSINIETDVFSIQLNTIGADIRNVQLKKYPLYSGKPEPFLLLSDQLPRIFIAQTGLISNDPITIPDHNSLFTTAQKNYTMTGDKLEVSLNWQKDNIEVIKKYTFYKKAYLIQFDQRIVNLSEEKISLHEYRQIQRNESVQNASFGIVTYTGGIIYNSKDKYQKYDFKELGNNELNQSFSGGWMAMSEHYFVGAWLPEPLEINQYYGKSVDSSIHIIGMHTTTPLTIEPGKSAQFTSKLYLGPKIQDDLREIAPGLELTVDYGIFTIFAEPLFWLLKKIHGLLNNWGWAIVILTLMIKLLFYKLSEASYRSMANMRRIQPRLVALKERFASDKQGFNQAMIDIYKKEKINPLGGCFPILVQIPVFIALYWMLLESVEMRQAPFILWITDLSAKDPYFVLPLIMGGTMFLQQKLNPAPIDPLQQKVMMAMPIVFTFFFAFFPSGLVLYWCVNNILSIIQQYIITKRIEGKNP